MTNITSNCSENNHEERCYKNKGNVWCGYEYGKGEMVTQIDVEKYHREHLKRNIIFNIIQIKSVAYFLLYVSNLLIDVNVGLPN